MKVGRAALWAVRYGLPIVLSVSGIVGFFASDGKGALAGGSVVMIGLGITVWMINWLIRMTYDSKDDRDKEEAAREYFTQHGRWPGEGNG